MSRTPDIFRRVKDAATGRWIEILCDVAGIPREILDGNHFFCPKCADRGHDRFRLIDKDVGAVFCNQCFANKNGDGISAVGWMLGVDNYKAAILIAEYLGLDLSDFKRKKPPAIKAKKATASTPDANEPVADTEAAVSDDVKRASAEIRDRVYREMLRHAPLSEKHRSDLMRRGFEDDTITALEFGSLPRDEMARSMIVRRVLEDLETDGVTSEVLLTVPGFVPSSNPKLLTLSPTVLGGILIPVRSHLDSKIIAVKVRVDDELLRREPDGKTKDGKYRFLSSCSKENESGPKAEWAVHCPKLLGLFLPQNALRISEGELKSDLVTYRIGLATISVPGVNGWKKAMPIVQHFKSKRVLVAFDADRNTNPAVAEAQAELVASLRELGDVKVCIETWPAEHGKGIDDVFAGGHEPAVIEDDELVDQHIAECLASSGVTKATGKDDRIEIVISPDESVVNEAAIGALAKDEALFQRGGKLVHVISGVIHDGINRPGDAAHVAAVPLAGLRERLTRFVRFTKAGDDEERKQSHPPKWCYEAIAARGQWAGIRPLAGVVTAPVLRPDGSVLNSFGYDPQTKLLFDPQGMTFPIIERPTREDALRSAAALLDVVCDFPFAKAEHRSTWLAYLLTPLARFSFTGPAPLFLVDANVRGTGKSLLCDLVGLIVTGRDMPRMSNPKDDEESRKRITSLALAGDTLCLIDNIVGGLGCASLDAALTATIWKDRILGRTESVELSLNVTWSATGNNVVLHSDTSRRVAHIRFDSQLENPEQREGFKHPEVKAYVLRHRAKVLADALTILAAYCCAGRPQQKLPTWGSFEGWSDLVRQAVVWCGLSDPGQTRTELVEQSDREAVALSSLLAGWDDLDPECHGLTAAEILGRLSNRPNDYQRVREAILELCPSKTGGLPTVKTLGNKLRHLRRRFVGSRCLDYREGRGHKRSWRIVRGDVSIGDTGDTGDTPTEASTRENVLSGERHSESVIGELAAIVSPESPVSPLAVTHITNRDTSWGGAGSSRVISAGTKCRIANLEHDLADDPTERRAISDRLAEDRRRGRDAVPVLLDGKVRVIDPAILTKLNQGMTQLAISAG